MVSPTTSSQFLSHPDSRFVHASYINSASFCFRSKVGAKARGFCRCGMKTRDKESDELGGIEMKTFSLVRVLTS